MNQPTMNTQEIFGMCLKQLRRKWKLFWLIRIEHHMTICAKYEGAKVCEHMNNERHYQKKAALAKADRVRLM